MLKVAYFIAAGTQEDHFRFIRKDNTICKMRRVVREWGVGGIKHQDVGRRRILSIAIDTPIGDTKRQSIKV